ncbi:3-dehydroquinate synthase II [Desulfovermiculus halophilus]|jgi:3-dehydroquinate synthase II|uniref:3-dehydroquinate synthase II n=1 Tax=Desulfovermiculus halophilus TaxID=339722 RepID=UPI000488EB01|nr:3-dehydroquinate synthase II [Desulfovermiculus halophilus]
MSCPIYVRAVPFDKSLVTQALEAGADGMLVDEEHAQDVLALSRTQVLTPADTVKIELTAPEDEERAARALQAGQRVLLAQGWEIIPVENLLAHDASGLLGLEVADLEQARLAQGILERGADFMVFCPQDPAGLTPMLQELKLRQEAIDLESAEITEITPVGLGHRVCVDTCSLLHTGQGLLVGNSSTFTFLVHAETESNPYVADRPFRINAGAAHAYVLLPGDRTAYLQELGAGREVLIVDAQGQTQGATVGRAKVEVRPLLLITARTADRTGHIFVQNAETIRLVRADGRPASVVSLQPSDQILCRTDAAGRHFGMRIQESIEEK